MTLTKKESKEPMMLTWGRIYTNIRFHQNLDRLQDLANKFNEDLKNAKVEENYFKGSEFDKFCDVVPDMTGDRN